MEKFIRKHIAKIAGKKACFDRILFKGYLTISWTESMQRFLMAKGLLIMDFNVPLGEWEKIPRLQAKTLVGLRYYEKLPQNLACDI